MKRRMTGKQISLAIQQLLAERDHIEGDLKAYLDAYRKGELKGTSEALLRLVARAGIALTEGDRTRIQTCEDSALLDRWLDNALKAKTAADVFSCTDP